MEAKFYARATARWRRGGGGRGTDGKGYTKVRWYIGFLLGVDQKKGSKKRRRRRRKRMRWWQRRRLDERGTRGGGR